MTALACKIALMNENNTLHIFMNRANKRNSMDILYEGIIFAERNFSKHKITKTIL